MSEQFRVRQPPLSSQIISGFVHVGCVPVDNRGEDEVQRHDAFLLSGVGTVLNAALRMREYGAVQPTLAGVTKKRDMNRQSKPVFSASPRADQIRSSSART